MPDKLKPENPDTHPRQSFAAGIVIAALLMAILFAANLPMKFVEQGRTTLGVLRLSRAYAPSEVGLPTMAGWPLRYLIRYPDEDEPRFFAPARMLCDLALILAIGVGVFWIVRFREKTILASANPRRTQKVADLLFAMLILLLPIAFLYAAKMSGERQYRLLRELEDHCSVESSCWFPGFIADKIPSSIRKYFLRPRSVEMFDAGSDQVAILEQLPGLVGVGFYQCEISDDQFTKFSKHYHLSRLSMISQPITHENVSSLASLKYITRLTLIRNGLTAELLEQLQHWDGLSAVNLNRNPIKLSEFSQPVWAKSVMSLELTRPDAGESDQLFLSDWLRLRDLSVRRRTTEANVNPLTIRLDNLPELERLHLDRYQKHDLELRNLPQFTEIVDFPESTFRRVEQDVWVPSGCWVQSLRLKAVPRLSQCDIFTRDLNSFEVDDMCNVQRAEFSSQLMSSLGWARKQVGRDAFCQSLINELGKADGPNNLTFRALPLQDVDISVLKQNKGIHRLHFIDCGITAGQASSLAPMNQLIELNLDTCVITDDRWHSLLDDFPNLEAFVANGKELRRFDLVHSNPLRQLHLDRLENVDSLRLIDQPSLNAHLRFTKSPDTLVIKNAESLQGIVLERPLKPGAIIGGLRDLQWFAAGGPEVTDEIVEQVLMCPDLDRLTLAYPQLSRAMLHQIGQATRLTALLIPGAGVDQEITDSWNSLRKLWEINLDDSVIGGRTLRWLGENESLRAASLARCKIDEEGLQSLSSLFRLVELSLADLPVRYSHLATLLAGDALEYLDLSGCDIDDALLQGISKSNSLRVVKLNRCSLSDAQNAALKASKPNLSVITSDRPLRTQRRHSHPGSEEPKVGERIHLHSETGFVRRSDESIFDRGASPIGDVILNLDLFRT